MISEQQIYKIIEQLKTTDSMYEFLFEVGKLHDYLYKPTNRSVTEIISEVINHDHAQILVGILENKGIEESATILKEIENRLKNAPKFGITIAFKYDAAFASIVYDWLKQNMSGNYLIEFTYDPEIIGGGIFTYDGHFKDYSLKKELKLFFSNQDGLQKLI